MRPETKAFVADFVKLSEALTGLTGLNAKLAEDYYGRLLGHFESDFHPVLVNAYRAVAAAPDLLAAFLAHADVTPPTRMHVVRQIVNAWYLSQISPDAANPQSMIDAGSFEQGRVWTLIGAHPIGFSHQPHGYWASRPA
jgi:Membrane bound FAD containing D-sorbitol dehydrogenase